MYRNNQLKVRKGPIEWSDIRGKGIGYFAFAMHRFSGLIIVFYLYLHLIVLSNLLRGPFDYNRIIKGLTYGPLDSFLVLDVLLALVIFYHGANGTRLALNEMGISPASNKVMFYVFESVSMIVLVVFLYYAYMFIGVA
ncbi:MAG: succinate dehydrogenase [Thermoplasmatales archaeon]